MRFLILFIFLISNSIADEVIDIKNLVINKELKKYSSLTFFNAKNEQLNLKDFEGKLIILNFWATWCAPCKEEMPSLDLLQKNKIGKDDIKKSVTFFKELNIKNLEIYFDSPVTLAKKFNLRGIPTSILFNKDGLEFARIIGSIDFEDKNFIRWLSNYN